MEAYAQVLNIAIPVFFILIVIEYLFGLTKGVKTIRSMDTISSLSSGMSNILKDVLGLTIKIVTYGFLVKWFAVFDIKATWLLVVLAFIGKDFAGYWVHRIEHMVNVFWNRHIVHHSSEEFNLSCALRQSISGFTSIFVIFYLPMAILGVPQSVIAVVAPLHLFAQFWYHTTLIKRMGFLEYIIVTPAHHRVHHAINPEYIDKNFSQIFIVWDKLFGTFQEELDEVPAVYGTKKPAATWNPFLINFQHIWQLAKDAWHAQSYWDKFRLWFMPTGWRPKDVAERFPIEIIEDPYSQVKYETKASFSMIVWSWVKLIITVAFILYLFNHIGVIPWLDVLLYGGFTALAIFSYTTLMDRSVHAFWLEILTSALGFTLMYKMGGWFMIDDYFSFGSTVVAAYFVLSVIVVSYFVLFDIRLDGKKVLAT